MTVLALTREESESITIRVLTEALLEPVVLTPADELAALPLDSFGLVDLVTDLQDELGIVFTHHDVQGLATVADLAGLVRQRVAERG